MCYFIYWLIQFPFLLISPQKIRWLFVVKVHPVVFCTHMPISEFEQAMVVPATWIAMLIWAFARVPSSLGLFKQHTSLHGADLSWAWLSALNSALGLYSTLAVNIPDFTVSVEIFRSLRS